MENYGFFWKKIQRIIKSDTHMWNWLAMSNFLLTMHVQNSRRYDIIYISIILFRIKYYLKKKKKKLHNH